MVRNKLLEKLAGNAADKRRGYEYRQHQAIATTAPPTSFMVRCAASGGEDMPSCRVALYVFHHHYGVIDDDPYGQHQAEQGQVIPG